MIENNDKNIGEENGESTLFTAPAEPLETLNTKRKKNLMLRQRRIAIVLVAVVLVGIIAYFAAIVPAINKKNEVEVKSVSVEVLPGEVIEPGTSSYINEDSVKNNDNGTQTLEIVGEKYTMLIFERCSRSEISRVDVTNEYGKFGFYRDEEDGQFYVTDYPVAPYDAELFSSFIVSTGVARSLERVHIDCDNMAEYGLAPEQNPASYTLTTKEGNKHTVYIGDLTPAGDGYYVRYEGRNAVYIMTSMLGDTVMQPLEVMITPQITLPMNESDYFALKNFTILNGKEREVTISFFSANEVPKEELKSEGAGGVYKMLYPENYDVNTVNYATALETFLDFKGIKTVKYAPSEEDLTEYGLLEPAHTVYYVYREIEQMVTFSKPTDNGTYYVYSPMYNLIAEVSDDSLAWLDWSFIQWVDLPMFMMNINDVKTVSVKSAEAERIFDLTGTGEELVVTERTTGFKPEVQNFRQFYKLLIITNIWDYAKNDRNYSEDKITALTNGDPYLTLTIETRKGEIKEFKIYKYSTNYAYYTENGEGEFLIMLEKAEKIISDAENVMTNTAIDADAHQ